MAYHIRSVLTSIPKRMLAAVCIGVTVAAVALIALWPSSTPKASINGHKYAIEFAQTEAEREQGLGGRASMPDNAGMLFVFGRSEQYCFWMKDMHFSLDIIWLDTRHRVVDIERNLSPATYPTSYCSDVPARYVLELNAGQAKQAGIKQGSLIQF